MGNPVSPVDLPDRRTYDAVLGAQEILREQLALREPGHPRIGNDEVRAAVKKACGEVDANPLLVITCIEGRRRRKGERKLTVADVDRGVFAARHQLHKEAVSQNDLNALALAVVLEMDELPIPRYVGEPGSPLSSHVQRAVIQTFGLGDIDTPADVRTDGRFSHSREVAGRVGAFFRAVATPHLLPDDKSWSKYLDANFAVAGASERKHDVHFWVLKPARKLIERRIAEIDEIIRETTVTRRSEVQERLSAFATRARLGASGQSQRAL